MGARKVGARRRGAQHFALFLFSSPRSHFSLFFSLWGSSRGILVVFEAPGPPPCARLEFSGYRVKPRRRIPDNHTAARWSDSSTRLRSPQPFLLSAECWPCSSHSGGERRLHLFMSTNLWYKFCHSAPSTPFVDGLADCTLVFVRQRWSPSVSHIGGIDESA